MSSVVYVGVVAEGLTDHIVLERIFATQVAPKELVYTALQPEMSNAFQALNSDFGFGWGGVYRWAKQVKDEGGGSVSGSVVMRSYDVLAIHLDCDVASKRYADANLTNQPNDLPCEMPCPPAIDTIVQLERVVLNWVGETNEPPKKLVICVPAWATEGWMLAALYPDDPDVIAGRTDCVRDPAARLSGKPAQGRLVSGGKKRSETYRERSLEIAGRWKKVVALADSARRFDAAVMHVVAELD